jgi:hypothetical protein
LNIFILALVFQFAQIHHSVAQSTRVREQDYAWGKVLVQESTGGYHVSVNIPVTPVVHEFSQRARLAKTSVARSTLETSAKVERELSRVISLAVQPEAAVSVTFRALFSVLLDPNSPLLASDYQQTSDSSVIQPLYSSLSNAGISRLSPSARLVGYEWFRGLRIARISVQPYSYANGDLRLTTQLSLEVTISNSKPSGKTRTQKDTHLADVLNTLVVNAKDVESLSMEDVPWSDSTGLWISSTQKYIKIKIPADRIYRIGYSDLSEKLSNLSGVDPRTFRLLDKGKDIPAVVKGEEDGIFDPGDYIEFVGLRNYSNVDIYKVPSPTEQYPEYMDRYTDTSFYWLTWGGMNGLRIPGSGFVAAVDTLRWYTEFLHIEQNNFIQFVGGNNITHQDPRWLYGDVWFWDYFGGPGQNTRTFSASNIERSRPTAKLSVRFSSWAAQVVNPAHRLRLSINDSDTLDRKDAQAYDHITLSGIAPISKVLTGSNTIRIHSLATSSSLQGFMFDWLEVEYPRKLSSEGDSLVFGCRDSSVSGLKLLQIDNVGSSNVVIYRIKPEIARIESVVIGGTGPYTIFFSDTVRYGSKYFLWTSATIGSPIVGAEQSLTDLRDLNRGADYVVISGGDVLAPARSYAAAISAKYGFRYEVVDVQKVFDQFGYGYPRPESIREFLRFTANWQLPMPSYVLLAGDANYDYKNYVLGSTGIKPTPNIVPSYGMPVSDVWFTVLPDSGSLPQMYIGRIPAMTSQEFSTYASHAITYLNTGNDDWNKRYIMFSGGLSSTEANGFRSTNEQLISNFVVLPPTGGESTHFYKTYDAEGRLISDFGPYTIEEVKKRMNAGALMLNYIGHAATQTWDNGITDISQLQNTRNKFTLISDFGCSTAKFGEPDIRSFGELATVGPMSSAIGYVGNTSLGFTSVALTLPEYFFRKFLRDSILPLGKSHLLAKLERIGGLSGLGAEYPPTVNRILLYTNTLLGDPSIELAAPKKPNFNGLTFNAEPEVITDELDSARLHIQYLNTGSVVDDSLTISVTSSYANSPTLRSIRRKVPLFHDSTVSFIFPTKDKPGEHDFQVLLNSDGRIPEIRTDENSSSFRLIVNSDQVRIVEPSPSLWSDARRIVFLNPFRRLSVGSEILELEIDTISTFGNALRFAEPFGQISTTFHPMLLPRKKYFWRTRVLDSGKPWVPGSFRTIATPETEWGQEDSTELSSNSRTNVAYSDNGLRIANGLIQVKATSAGFNDGQYSSVEINGLNILTSTFNRGHTVVVLDSAGFRPKSQRSFDTFGSGALAESLRVYLESIPVGEFVVEVIADEGSQNLSNTVRDGIKALGSLLIDSVQFRDSWAIIGRKGAPAGSALEVWKKAYSGKAVVETTFVEQIFAGKTTSAVIGPSSGWDSLSVNSDISSGGSVNVKVIGIRNPAGEDTLLSFAAGGTFGIQNIDAKKYPRVKLVGELSKNSIEANPTLRSWSVTLQPPAELAVNYQSLRLSAERILEGGIVTIQLDVRNPTSRPVDSVMVTFTVLNQFGILPIDTLRVVQIPADSFVTTSFVFPTAGRKGANTLYFSVDPAFSIPEVYENNNAISYPIIVEFDSVRPQFDFFVDDQRMFENDFIGTNPEIKVNVYDNSPLPLLDPNNIILKLNNRRVQLGSSPESLYTVGSGSLKGTAIFKPQLKSGLHQFSIQVKDSSGNFADTSARILNLRVQESPGLLNVVNYPNPFAVETYFTFNLVGANLPQEASIKIFSVAGRQVQSIRIPQADLRFGFNRIAWDGKDFDGSDIANGVYFYKISFDSQGKTIESLNKLAKVR